MPDQDIEHEAIEISHQDFVSIDCFIAYQKNDEMTLQLLKVNHLSSMLTIYPSFSSAPYLYDSRLDMWIYRGKSGN